MIQLKEAFGLPVEQIGGKAHRLAALEHNGFAVKPAIVLDVGDIERLQTDDTFVSVACDLTRSTLRSFHGYAVRSSAVGEDGELSWAGQFDSRLNVSDDGLADAIRSCVAAVRSEVVVAYARTHWVPVPKLALIIQEMVPARISGVMFTADPLTYSSDTMVIEIVAGIGESLVSGAREPKRFYLDARDGSVVRTEGSRDPECRPQDISQLHRIGLLLRRLFEGDQDVEWAIEEGSDQLFLNQSRNITGLHPGSFVDIRARAQTDIEHALFREQRRLRTLGLEITRDVLSDQNIAEIVTPHPCRMAFGLFTYVFAHGDGAIRMGRNEIGYEIGDELTEGFFEIVGDQPRCSIVHDAFTYRIAGIPLDDYLKLVQRYLDRIAEDERLANYPEVVLYDQNPSLELLIELFGTELATRYREAYERFFSRFRAIEGNLARAWSEDASPAWERIVAEAYHIPADATLSDLATRYRDMADALRVNACRWFVKAARTGFFAYARLRNLLMELFGTVGEEYANILTGGIPVELNPNLLFNVRLAELRDGRIGLDEVLSDFGHLGSHELEISVPRYREQPELIRKLAGRIAGDPLADFQASASRASELRADLLVRAGERRDELEREIGIARTYLPLREVVKFAFLRGFDVLRTLTIRIEQLLGWESGLIFHLDPREVFLIASRCDELRLTAHERRIQHDVERALFIPAVLFSDSLEAIGRPPIGDGSRQLRGVGVTNIIAEGKAVVVRNFDDQDSLALLGPGMVLVTVTTDPAWSPVLAVMGNTGALVTEVGGLLAHGAIYAREVGIAAVLNVPQATSVIKTGMRVRVNGPAGTVEILDQDG